MSGQKIRIPSSTVKFEFELNSIAIPVNRKFLGGSKVWEFCACVTFVQVFGSVGGTVKKMASSQHLVKYFRRQTSNDNAGILQ